MTQRRGFTLIEMLLVVAIIGSLSALLFGVLGPARESSRRSVCASSLHQWGTAFAMYVQDYDGIDPQIGLSTSHAQLGLPPANYTIPFMKQYKIYNTAIMTCPSAHYTKPPGPLISYHVPAFYGEGVIEGYGNLVAQYGPSLALITCDMHNVDTDWYSQPSWAKKWVQSIHMDQHLVWHQVPVHSSDILN